MHEPTPDEILKLARRQLAQRRSRLADAHPAWGGSVILLGGILLLSLLLAPGAALDAKLALLVSGLCDQHHTLILGDHVLPLCARDTGIYLSFALALIALQLLRRNRAAGLPPRTLLLVLLFFVLSMALDGINSVLNEIGALRLYPPDNRLRLLTGLGMGVALAVLQHWLFVRTLRADADRTAPVVRNWAELVALLGSGLLLALLLVNTVDVLYWPLAWLSVLGIIGSLYLMSLLLLSLALGYAQRVTRWTQLARPALFAVVPTLILVVGSAALRQWLTSP